MATSSSTRHSVLKSDLNVHELFVHGLLLYELRDYDRAEQRMTEILSKAKGQDQGILRSKAAGVLGLIELGRGRLEEASAWLSEARSQPSGQFESPWALFLGSAIATIRAKVATEHVIRQITHTKSELEDESRLLQGEIAHFSEGVYYGIKGIAPEIPRVDNTFDAVRRPLTGLQDVINVRLLGRFRARLNDGSQIQLCSNRKGQAIFEILVTRPSIRLHKEILLELLWPREDPDISFGKLHTAISRLRRALRASALGDECLLFENDYYFISPEFNIVSDVARFERHADKGIRLESTQRPDAAIVELEMARSLYSGAYVDETRGEDWPIMERTRLEARYLEVLSRLAILYFGRANLSSCVGCCETLLRHDNLREDACRLLMQAYFIGGNRVQAIRAYRDLRASLKRELGVEPDRATRELLARIREP